MNNITNKLGAIFNSIVYKINNNKKSLCCSLNSNKLITEVICVHDLYFGDLKKLASVFNSALKSLKNLRVLQNIVKIFITKDYDTFENLDNLFNLSGWSSNYRIRQFNLATFNKSKAKCTNDNKFYVIKCYDYLFYIYNKETNQCLIVTTGDKKAISMINILLLAPYLLFRDVYAIHGGLVSDGRNNIIITGDSLNGKTTLSLLFLENGWKIITEETTYITKYGNILEYNPRNYLTIRQGTYFEFKDLFIKKRALKIHSLIPQNINKKRLFDYGKKGQTEVYFENLGLCTKNLNLKNKQITHVLTVSLDKNMSGIIIKQDDYRNIIKKFLKISFAPTTMLFRNLIDVNFSKNKAKKEIEQHLTSILKNTKHYMVISGLDYRKHFNSLLDKIEIN